MITIDWYHTYTRHYLRMESQYRNMKHTVLFAKSKLGKWIVPQDIAY